jgi:leucyl-tRNA synthetase
MDFRAVEEKWQEKWADGHAFEGDPSGRGKKFFLTAAFPYPNSPQHIGHARTYSTTDAYARFKRMSGHNVLFPMAFHVTGTPVLAMAKRVACKDPEITSIFRDVYKIPEDVIPTLDEPVKLVSYFSREIELGMREMGFSIDWRRKFYTYDPVFSKFIEWQFFKLKEGGYLTKGTHPVPWCPKDDNAVGAHDTVGDKDPEIEEMVLIKFALDGAPGEAFLCATFRPETIYGVTNLWVNPTAGYALVELEGGKYWVSAEAAESLSLQFPSLKKIGERAGSEFEGRLAVNPETGAKVPVFPASFVEPGMGSGAVMSVPAHAPFDFLALRDLEGTKWKEMVPQPVQVLKLEGFGSFPAKEIVERMRIPDQGDARAEEATEEIYSREAHTGVMAAGKYKGMRGVEAKEKIKADMLAEGKAFPVFEVINGPIKCRCGGRVVVKSVRDQWFIDYASPEWKEKARKCLAGMSIVPEKTRGDYEYTIGWLKEKACVRAQGLGTRFPFDESKVIESLSDSTIYMAFYAIAVRAKKIEPEKLKPELFDFVFLGRGAAGDVASSTGISEGELEAMRAEFLYWYPLDSRHSGADLIHNHLTFFIFNHAAVFPEALWPRQIAVNGFVLMDGSKMSKSLGNILPLREAIRKYGADVVRFSVVSGAELDADSDFNQAMAEGVSSRLKWMAGLIGENCAAGGSGEQAKAIDAWLLSRMHRRLKRATQLFDSLVLREITQEALYSSVNDLKWYFRHSKGNRETLREFYRIWVLMMAPFTPHVCEELWECMGGKGLVSLAAWPEADGSKISDKAELSQDVVSRTCGDIAHILKLTQKEPKAIRLFVAAEWKRRLYAIAFEEKRFDTAMKKAMGDVFFKANAKAAGKALQQLVKDVGTLRKDLLSEEEELRALSDSAEFVSREFGASVQVLKESDAPGDARAKAERAMPLKPSILIE